MLLNALFFVCAGRKNILHNGATARYEIIYPPVGPLSVCIPPRKPENTGNPDMPIRIYIPTEIVLNLVGRRQPQSTIANSPNVIGTEPAGMDSTENTQIIADNKAHKVKLLVFILR